jgi:hypothetical protein
MTLGFGPIGTRPIGAVPGRVDVSVTLETGHILTIEAKAQAPSNLTMLMPTQNRGLRAPAPPRNAEFLLYCFLSKEDRAGLIGDLMQEYQMDVLPKFGPRRANVWYWSQVMRSIAPVVLNFLSKLRKLRH